MGSREAAPGQPEPERRRRPRQRRPPGRARSPPSRPPAAAGRIHFRGRRRRPIASGARGLKGRLPASAALPSDWKAGGGRGPAGFPPRVRARVPCGPAVGGGGGSPPGPGAVGNARPASPPRGRTAPRPPRERQGHGGVSHDVAPPGVHDARGRCARPRAAPPAAPHPGARVGARRAPPALPRGFPGRGPSRGSLTAVDTGLTLGSHRKACGHRHGPAATDGGVCTGGRPWGGGVTENGARNKHAGVARALLTDRPALFPPDAGRLLRHRLRHRISPHHRAQRQSALAKPSVSCFLVTLVLQSSVAAIKQSAVTTFSLQRPGSAGPASEAARRTPRSLRRTSPRCRSLSSPLLLALVSCVHVGKASLVVLLRVPLLPMCPSVAFPHFPGILKI